MRLSRYKRTIPYTTSGEAMFVSPTHEATGPSTSTPIRLASKGSALNISLSTLATSTATEKSTETATEGGREEYANYISYSYVQNVHDKCA